MPYVLVIDDDRDFLSALEVVLGNKGYEVSVESTPQGGLKRIHARRPDLLIRSRLGYYSERRPAP